eukprot:TRINITY_DN92252_c0_g1_i1.p1 TRINITY_DN92252_c0_g1~~TRINITY_DN92252_c0_g1_i1.p1  ORF type:complete len:316 (+),score=43.26 TRINITY_DN92252_c0_g1_i1:67-1014(+)
MPTCILITGANIGLGFECARQLAYVDGVKKILLACRNEDKAAAAKRSLQQLTNTHKFEIIAMDVSNLGSVKKAVEKLNQDETVIDGIVLNAGGGGGSDPKGLTVDGVTNSMAVNVLGHVLLVDELVNSKRISEHAASIVYSGSESARGVPAMSLKPPKLESGSVEEFMSICNGSFFPKDAGNDPKYLGAFAKFVGALWMSSMARKYPNIRFVTMSPGATTGTAVRRDLPCYKRMLVGTILKCLSLKGKAHSLEVGAKRYVDALLDHATYQSGIFYASKVGLSGEVGDQSELLDYFSNHAFQDNANDAIHNFLGGK